MNVDPVVVESLHPDIYQPRFPRNRVAYGIAFVGCGSVVQRWQLPQYLDNGLRVVGAFDNDPDAIAAATAIKPDLKNYPSLEALLEDSSVDVVDIATTVRGRSELILRALAAGKHVLAQKPLCLDRDELEKIRKAAQPSGAPKFAVNFNGRWAPQWRAARHLIETGTIGEPFAITHIHDIAMSWCPDVERHGTRDFLLFDYMIHWVDCSQVWMGARSHYTVWAHTITRQAPESESDVTQFGWLNIVADGAVCASIRSIVAAQQYSGHPFLVHGSNGTIRGTVDSPAQNEYLSLERNGNQLQFSLSGDWFPDGFLGSIGDLLCAIEDGREPDAGIASAGLTQKLTFAACESAAAGGRPIEVHA